MGDRNNPIKFGPEWLRNLARERSAGSSQANNQNSSSTPGPAASGATMGAGGGTSQTSSATSAVPNTLNTTNSSPKVQLAKLRYGREEMLALFDRTAQAPPELKFIDMLYQPRGKPPFALNNSFEEDVRDTMRSGPLTGTSPGGDRFGIGRGMGRGMNVAEPRGKARIPFLRTPPTQRGNIRSMGSPRMPGYSGGTEEDTSTLRSWNNNKGGTTPVRNTGDQTEWSPNKMYISKRSGNNTNWRQSREEEEWRASDGARSRSAQQDKWDRDWGDRPQDKPQPWSLNRRTWVGNDSQSNEDNLPEWAVDNAEACAGTFDSSGAFHGYSNDDSNLPKSQDSGYALTRSHTHGSFVRSKTVEEGSDEWWASEKAKKLSPKRFDASDIKFKKSHSVIPELSSGSNSNTELNANKEETSNNKGLDNVESSTSGALAAADPGDNNVNSNDDNFNKRSVRFAESKTFDALMRSDINLEETSDERGNFQSVMINSNNSLRQKHQNIVSSANNNRQNRKPGLLQLLQKSSNQCPDSDLANQQTSSEEQIVDKILDINLDDREMITKMQSSNENLMSNQSTAPNVVNAVSQMNSPAMQLRMSSPVHPSMNAKSSIASSNNQPTGVPTPGLQNIGITSSALNASLGLPIGPTNNTINQTMGLPMQGVPSSVLPNQGLPNPGVGSVLQAGGQGMPSYQSSGVMPGMSGANVVNSSLFLGQNTNASSMQSSNDVQIGHGNQGNMFPLHGLQHSGSQAAFNSSIYSNIMQQSPASNPPNPQNLVDQWYYEDPKGQIQGPFASKEMYNWYRAGFFSASLMVRRACDAHMRPLGSYGPVVPFQQMDMLSSFPLSGGFESRNQGPQDGMLSSQPGMGLEVMNMAESNSIETMQFGTVGLIRNPPYGQQQMVESLWSQPSPTPDLLWMQQAINARNENRVNNLPMFFWEQQPSAITSNSLLPEDIAKEMKTEDQILAQLRASQSINPPQKLPFMNDQTIIPPPPPPATKPEDVFPPNVNVAPDLEELQKFMREDTLKETQLGPEAKVETETLQVKLETVNKSDQSRIDNSVKPQVTNKAMPESKKQVKSETDKSTKNKENNATKNKSSKKIKDDKKEDLLDANAKEDETIRVEKRHEESSPSKIKKEDKQNKKELEKEKKEWIKEGFTIVKTEKSNKDNKKKLDETKAAEEAERKRRDEERLAAEEEKKRKQIEAIKKQQEIQQQQRQIAESVAKKAPWSAVSSQAVQAPNKDGLTLAEIQRLEREKKLEQMKEQQQMMQIIAQQQAAALAREQEMQAGLGWAKKKGGLNSTGQSLTEIQAEARKQAAAAAAAAASQALEDIPTPPQPQLMHVPWGNSHNGGGFWDTQPTQPQPKPQEPAKTVDPIKIKKKPVILPTKQEVTPAAEFEIWCTTVLTSWSAKIDVPTFVGFLKDIESPYEVKDYVKCYLGDTKDSNDFARQFLERRSKLLRVGMVTPSDDLCSPAIAVNPRTIAGSDYQEVKSKSKKTKKSKMLKVDNRILGFSVTAAEDRINVGDIDTV